MYKALSSIFKQDKKRAKSISNSAFKIFKQGLYYNSTNI